MLTVINLAALDGADGFRLHGQTESDLSGYSVRGAGDLNGDGLADIIIGAPGASETGVSYVVFGKASGFSVSVALSVLDGSDGFRLDGRNAGDSSGISVSGANDVNGDGLSDIIIGASFASPSYLRESAGESYVVFGSTSDFAAEVDLSALDGGNGFRMNGVDGTDFSGDSVSNAGDFNGDGFADIIIGAPSARPSGKFSAGETYIVFGSASGFEAEIDLDRLSRANGLRIEGADSSDHSGADVNSAGNVNGDGFDDIIIGGYGVSLDGKFSAGASYVVFGQAVNPSTTINLDDLDGADGFRLDGVNAGEYSGASSSGAGDVNGDGIGDIFVNSILANPGGKEYAGSSYVIFGQEVGFGATVDLESLDGANGFRVDGASSRDQTGKPGFPMWDRPNQESMVGKGLICKQVASDGRRRANPIDRGPIGGRAGLKQAC